MNARISMLALAMLTGMSMAAVTTVMSFEDGKYKKGEIAPYGNWYTYADSTNGATASIKTGTTAMEISAKVVKTKDTYAGAGFIWAKNGDAADLSAFEGMGVCLTYTSTADFRMEFKQSNIKNSNFNGVLVQAQSEMNTVYFPFADFAQEDWGQTTNVDLDLSKQTGVNFSYKTALAGPNVNTISIAAFSFGKSCVNTAPTLKEDVVSPDEVTLPEGDTLKVAFEDIFEDIDGDDLNITATVSGYVEDLKGAKSYSLKDVAWIVSKPNPTGDNTTGKVTFTATDAGNQTVSYVVNLALVDRDNPPVANDDAYEVDEDSELTVDLSQSLLLNDTDADGDAFVLLSYTQPENGTVVVDASTGEFTYTPNADFHGTDTFTYTISDVAGEETSVGTVTITVNNVDDPATVTINDSTIYVGAVVDEAAIKIATGIAVAEDFETFKVFIPVANVEFIDPDAGGSSYADTAKSQKGLVTVQSARIGVNYVLSVSSVPDANGSDTILLFAVIDKDTLSIGIPVSIAAVADPPKAVADTFTVIQDSVNSISAAKGLLVNDVNPDGKSTLKAYLATDAEHGKVVVDTTGAFTYDAEEYEGEDSFTYVIKNAEGEESVAATVVLNVVYKNRAPVVVAGVADTVSARVDTLKEDFATSILYRTAEVKSWFEDPEGHKITFSLENPDSIVSATINTATAAITIKSVKDACGETFINVIATDSLKAATTLKIPVTVSCQNDKPVRVGGAIDTVLVPPSGWRKAFSVFDLFSDVDDTTLVMTTSAVDRFLKATVEGDSLIVTLLDETQYLQNHVAYNMSVSATDAGGLSTTAPKKLTFMVGENLSTPVVKLASLKATWQGAIRAERGVANIFDMQGRMLWKSALPVSEEAVRNAAAKVQGRKILQVNKQVWTIK